MAVIITNVTDAPESKKTPVRLAVYTAHLDPGESLKLPATHVDARLRTLEKQGYIAIGQLPSWYDASKAKKLGRHTFTAVQLKEKFSKKKPAKKKGDKKAAPAPAPVKTPVKVPAPSNPGMNSVPTFSSSESAFKAKKEKKEVSAVEDKDKKHDKP